VISECIVMDVLADAGGLPGRDRDPHPVGGRRIVDRVAPVSARDVRLAGRGGGEEGVVAGAEHGRVVGAGCVEDVVVARSSDHPPVHRRPGEGVGEGRSDHRFESEQLIGPLARRHARGEVGRDRAFGGREVGPVAQRFEDVAVNVGILDALAPVEHVVTGFPTKEVLPVLAEQVIVAAAAEENVVAVVSIDLVVSGTATDHVVAGGAADHPVAGDRARRVVRARGRSERDQEARNGREHEQSTGARPSWLRSLSHGATTVGGLARFVQGPEQMRGETRASLATSEVHPTGQKSNKCPQVGGACAPSERSSREASPRGIPHAVAFFTALILSRPSAPRGRTCRVTRSLRSFATA
jgi:hypothetical protein